MPAHIYLRTGKYHDATESSVLAIQSDRLYVQKCFVPYVPLHNIAMLVSASLLNGNFLQALLYSPFLSYTTPSHAAFYVPALTPTPRDIILAKMGRWTDILDIYKLKNSEELRMKEQRELRGSRKMINESNRKMMNKSNINESQALKTTNNINKEINKKILRSVDHGFLYSSLQTQNYGYGKIMENNQVKRFLRLSTNQTLISEIIDTSTRPPYIRSMELYSQTLAYTGIDNIEKAKEYLDFLSETVENIPYDDLPVNHPFYPNHHEIGEIFLLIAKAAFMMKNMKNSLIPKNYDKNNGLKIELNIDKNSGNNIDQNTQKNHDKSTKIIVENIDNSIIFLKNAVGIQDSFSYMEPESFYFPVRQCLGAVLLKKSENLSESDDKIEVLLEAINVYKYDLHEHPNNIWTLKGLQIAYTELKNQKKLKEIQTENDIEDEQKIFELILDLGPSIRTAFAYTDIDYLNIKGSCCELSLC